MCTCCLRRAQRRSASSCRDCSNPTTQYFNRRYRKVGHLFQGRYQAIICDKDKYLLALIRYIHLNPIRTGLAKRPEGYAYSGHRSYFIHGTPKIIDSKPILRLFAGNKRYERFVLDGIGEEHNEAYYAVEDQRFLGDEGFSEEISREFGETKERKAKEPIDEVFRKIARQAQVAPEVLRGPSRRWEIAKKRTEAVALLVREHGYRVGEVAKYLGRDQAHISTMLSRLAARKERVETL